MSKARIICISENSANFLSSDVVTKLKNGHFAIARQTSELVTKVDIIDPENTRVINQFHVIGGRVSHLLTLEDGMLAVCFYSLSVHIQIYDPLTSKCLNSFYFSDLDNNESDLWKQNIFVNRGNQVISASQGWQNSPMYVTNLDKHQIDFYRSIIHVSAMLVVGDKFVLIGDRFPNYQTECCVFNSDFQEVQHIFCPRLGACSVAKMGDSRIIIHPSEASVVRIYDIITGKFLYELLIPGIDDNRLTALTVLDNGNIATCSRFGRLNTPEEKDCLIQEFSINGECVDKIVLKNTIIKTPELLSHAIYECELNAPKRTFGSYDYCTQIKSVDKDGYEKPLLPPEIWCEINNELSLLDKANFAQVCKGAYAIASVKETYGRFYNFPLRQLSNKIHTVLKYAVKRGDIKAVDLAIQHDPALLLQKSTMTDHACTNQYSLQAGEIQNKRHRKLEGTVFECMLRLGDTDMCQMLISHFSKMNNGYDEIKKQCINVFGNDYSKFIANQAEASYQFNDLMKAIINASEEDIKHQLDQHNAFSRLYASRLNADLQYFRREFATLALEEAVFNPYHTINAMKCLLDNVMHLNCSQTTLFWNQVIGFTQRFFPIGYLYDLSKDLTSKKTQQDWCTSRSDIHAISQTNAKWGILVELDYDPSYRLGFDYAISRYEDSILNEEVYQNIHWLRAFISSFERYIADKNQVIAGFPELKHYQHYEYIGCSMM